MGKEQLVVSEKRDEIRTLQETERLRGFLQAIIEKEGTHKRNFISNAAYGALAVLDWMDGDSSSLADQLGVNSDLLDSL